MIARDKARTKERKVEGIEDRKTDEGETEEGREKNCWQYMKYTDC